MWRMRQADVMRSLWSLLIVVTRASGSACPFLSSREVRSRDSRFEFTNSNYLDAVSRVCLNAQHGHYAIRTVHFGTGVTANAFRV